MRIYNTFLLYNMCRFLLLVVAFFAMLAPADCFGATFTARLPLYAENSKLSSGNWVKCRVTEDGVYKVTFDQLRAMGFKKPENVRVFGYGGRLLSESLTNDYLDDLPEVNSVLGDSYILFYGVANVEWKKKFGSDPFYFQKNAYSDYGYYFLSDIDGERRTVPTAKPITDPANGRLTTHYKHLLQDFDNINPFNGGNDWYDSPLSVGESRTYSFYCADMVDCNNGALSINCISESKSNANPSFTVSNGQWSFSPTQGINYSYGGLPLTSNSNYARFQVKFSCNLGSALGYVDYLKFSPLCYNRLNYGYLSFSNVSNLYTADVYDVVVANASSKTKVWNVSDPANVFAYKTVIDGDSLSFRLNTDEFNNFVAFNEKDGRFLSLEPVGLVANQNLHNFKGADLIILAPSSFAPYATQIGELHAEYDGLSYFVVTPELIYNEFSSGTPDPTAIRAFMKMLYDKSLVDNSYTQPRYLLLFGDGCYDNRGVVASSYSETHNLLLTYQTGSGKYSEVFDDYFGLLSDGKSGADLSDGKNLQIAIGRLPVSNFVQATDMVNKIGHYLKNNEYGAWKSKLLLIADDDEGHQDVHAFLKSSETMSVNAYKLSSSVQVKKVYLDNYMLSLEAGGRRYPAVEKCILDEVQNGAMFVNYLGHSNPINWSSEKIFTQSMVPTLTNKKLGIWFSGSCEFNRFDSYVTSCAESLVLAPNGGAIAVIGGPREETYYSNESFDRQLIMSFYSRGQNESIGDVVRNAKQMNEGLRFCLLGDPALRPNVPDMQVVTDSLSADTLSALSKLTIYGHVSHNGNLVPSFNGSVKVKVCDKEQECKTKGNTNSSAGSFFDYASVLFSGEVDVKNGVFSCDLIVPKDIVYSYGQGRVTYYAYDQENGSEAVGGDLVVVGGSADTEIQDTLGPAINLVVNNFSFKSGDVVGANPVLIGHVYDLFGINSSSVGLGHDISVSINGGDPVSLNDYFEYAPNSCTDGYFEFALGDLEDGFYTLTFKAWDLLNNSSKRTISFVVDKGKDEHVYSMEALPNPASTSTSVMVDYGHPLVNVDYEVGIYNTQGLLVNTMRGVESSSDGKLLLQWNLNDFNGSRVAPGVYIFRVDIKSGETNFSGLSEKIIVLPQ